MAAAYRRHTEVIADLVPPRGLRVVDVGCGDGGLVRWFARNGAADAIGVECGPVQLQRARAAAPQPGARVIEGRGEALPLDTGSADLVVFFNALHHVPVDHQAAALQEARRVLVDGGRLYIAEPIADGDGFELNRLVDDETEVRAAAYAALTTAPGFTPDRELTYLTAYVLQNFEDWRRDSTAITPDRQAAFDRHETDLRALFNRLGRPGDDGTGRSFDQPMRVNLLHRTNGRTG